MPTSSQVDLTPPQDTLELPVDYEVAIVTGSNTAAFEMAMWNLLGERDVHCIHFEAFGKNWYVDAAEQLKLRVTQHTCAYGQLPDLSRVDFDCDVMMTWNGTTSGVLVPHDAPIPCTRKGLTLVDATSAVFAVRMPWAACDVTTFSWQKALGGEGGHGVIVLSPRALQRLRDYTPPWPVPKLFRMKSGGKVEDALFRGSVLNTVGSPPPPPPPAPPPAPAPSFPFQLRLCGCTPPVSHPALQVSMLCVEDAIDALAWVKRIGGIASTIARCSSNFAAVSDFVRDNSPAFSFLASVPATRSCTSVCLVTDLTPPQLKAFLEVLDKEEVARDIASYRDAPAGIRIWCGPTVELSDLQALLPWLRWAHDECARL